MEAGATKQDTGRARRGQTKPHRQVRPDQPNRKRRRGGKDEDSIEHTRKSPRTPESPNKRCHNLKGKVEAQPSRKSPRLQEIRDLNQQRIAPAGKWTRSSPRTSRTDHCIEQEQPQAEHRALRTPRKCQNIPPPTSGTPVDGSPVSTRKRHRGQDDVVETQAKRQMPPGNQAQPSQALDTDVPTLTSKNLECLDRQISSQHLPSTEKTALREWEFENMPRYRKMETQSRRTEDVSSSTKTVSTSDPRFQETAVKNGILIPMQSSEPNNFSEIYHYFNRPRESMSPDAADYKEYLYDAVTADNEDTVKQAVLVQLKKYKDEGYRSAYNQQFTEYPSNIGINDGLSAPKPDLIQGISLEAFEPYPVKDRLGGSAVPTPSLFPITLAHMAGEFKRPGGNLIQARGQAAYDGASLVYGRSAARESMGRADSPGTAHVGSFISDGTHITTFAHYATRDAFGKIVYHQWPVTDTNIQLSHQSFKTGRRQARNLQDWTRRNSYLLKEELLDHYKLSQAQSNEQPIPEVAEENDFSEYGNDCSAGGPAEFGSEPYVLVDKPTQPESHPFLEPETSSITPKSFNSASSQHHDRLASNADTARRIPNQRQTRSSTRLSERRRREHAASVT